MVKSRLRARSRARTGNDNKSVDKARATAAAGGDIGSRRSGRSVSGADHACRHEAPPIRLIADRKRVAKYVWGGGAKYRQLDNFRKPSEAKKLALAAHFGLLAE